MECEMHVQYCTPEKYSDWSKAGNIDKNSKQYFQVYPLLLLHKVFSTDYYDFSLALICAISWYPRNCDSATIEFDWFVDKVSEFYLYFSMHCTTSSVFTQLSVLWYHCSIDQHCLIGTSKILKEVIVNCCADHMISADHMIKDHNFAVNDKRKPCVVGFSLDPCLSW